jgi:hypothetical protein
MIGVNDTLVRVFDNDGVPIGPAYSIAAGQAYHSLAPLESGGFVTVYTSNSIAYAQIFDPDGSPSGAALELGAISFSATWDIDVAGLSGGGFAASWRSDTEAVVKTFDAAGTPIAALVPATAPGGEAPQIAQLANGTLALFWHEHDSVSPFSGGHPDGYQVSGQIFATDGTVLTSKFITNVSQAGSHAAPELVALTGGGFVVTWVSNGPDAGIKAQMYDSAGTAVGSHINVSSGVPGYQTQPDIAALPFGGFLVSWEDSSPGNSKTFSRAYVRNCLTILAHEWAERFK